MTGSKWFVYIYTHALATQWTRNLNVINPIIKHPDFTALQGAIYVLKNLKQESSLNNQKFLN